MCVASTTCFSLIIGELTLLLILAYVLEFLWSNLKLLYICCCQILWFVWYKWNYSYQVNELCFVHLGSLLKLGIDKVLWSQWIFFIKCELERVYHVLYDWCVFFLSALLYIFSSALIYKESPQVSYQHFQWMYCKQKLTQVAWELYSFWFIATKMVSGRWLSVAYIRGRNYQVLVYSG